MYECHRRCVVRYHCCNCWRHRPLVLILRVFGQTKLPSNLTEETLKRLIGSTGRATSDITESTSTVLVNSEEFSAKTSKGIISKGTHVRVTETDPLTLLVEKS